MKEVAIFFVIMILALVFLFVIQGSIPEGANLIKALGFNIEKPEKPQEPEKTENKQTANYSEPKPKNNPVVENNQPKESSNNEEPNSNNEELAPLSPYYQKITISSVRDKTRTRPFLIKLKTKNKEEINITGWTIKTRHGEFEIPKGVEKYQSLKNEKDILVQGYTTIYLIGEKSPLTTDAFRINTCFGYLKGYKELYPSTYVSCPKPKKEDLYDLNPFCQEFVLDLRRCEIPEYSDNLKIATNYSCTKYLNENFNYSGCYKNYNKEEDFLKNYWYVYAGSGANLIEPLHDIISLHDQNGYLVDDYKY